MPLLRTCGCSACTDSVLYGYESYHVPYTHVSLTGSTWISRRPHLQAWHKWRTCKALCFAGLGSGQHWTSDDCGPRL